MLLAHDTVVEVDGIGKRFGRTHGATRKRLRRLFGHALLGRHYSETKLEENEFWALKDVSFSLKRGEAFGILGLNGAGKTTLLRIISGQLMPDVGEVRILGTSGSLIDLTAGFQTALSGRENVFIRGALKDMSRKEIESVYDDIVAFAELDEFINTPLKMYSSGMLMRLGFSIAIHIRPSLLLIDEILSVGDFRFRQKCLGRIREIRNRTSFVLVSHNMNDISRLCERAMVLQQGQVAFQGEAKECINFYQTQQQEKDRPPKVRGAFAGKVFDNDSVITDVEHFWADMGGAPISKIPRGESIQMIVRFRLKYTPRHFVIGVPIWTADGHLVTGISSEIRKQDFSLQPDASYEVRLDFPKMTLNPGGYTSVVSILDGREFLSRKLNAELTVQDDAHPHWGQVTLSHDWSISRI